MPKKTRAAEKPRFDVCYRDSITISTDTLYRLMADCAFSPKCVHLYLYFLSRANMNGDCEASYSEILDAVQISASQLTMMATHLQRRGYIKMEVMWRDPDGIHYENRYKILPQRGLSLGDISNKESYGATVAKFQRGVESATRYISSLLTELSDATTTQLKLEEHDATSVEEKPRNYIYTPEPDEIYGGYGPYLP